MRTENPESKQIEEYRKIIEKYLESTEIGIDEISVEDTRAENPHNKKEPTKDRLRICFILFKEKIANLKTKGDSKLVQSIAELEPILAFGNIPWDKFGPFEKGWRIVTEAPTVLAHRSAVMNFIDALISSKSKNDPKLILFIVRNSLLLLQILKGYVKKVPPLIKSIEEDSEKIRKIYRELIQVSTSQTTSSPLQTTEKQASSTIQQDKESKNNSLNTQEIKLPTPIAGRKEIKSTEQLAIELQEKLIDVDLSPGDEAELFLKIPFNSLSLKSIFTIIKRIIDNKCENADSMIKNIKHAHRVFEPLIDRIKIDEATSENDWYKKIRYLIASRINQFIFQDPDEAHNIIKKLRPDFDKLIGDLFTDYLTNQNAGIEIIKFYSSLIPSDIITPSFINTVLNKIGEQIQEQEFEDLQILIKYKKHADIVTQLFSQETEFDEIREAVENIDNIINRKIKIYITQKINSNPIQLTMDTIKNLTSQFKEYSAIIYENLVRLIKESLAKPNSLQESNKLISLIPHQTYISPQFVCDVLNIIERNLKEKPDDIDHLIKQMNHGFQIHTLFLDKIKFQDKNLTVENKIKDINNFFKEKTIALFERLLEKNPKTNTFNLILAYQFIKKLQNEMAENKVLFANLEVDLYKKLLSHPNTLHELNKLPALMPSSIMTSELMYQTLIENGVHPAKKEADLVQQKQQAIKLMELLVPKLSGAEDVINLWNQLKKEIISHKPSSPLSYITQHRGFNFGNTETKDKIIQILLNDLNKRMPKVVTTANTREVNLIYQAKIDLKAELGFKTSAKAKLSAFKNALFLSKNKQNPTLQTTTISMPISRISTPL